MAVVIGLDFGNFNSYTSTIENLDMTRGRLGGSVLSLLPSGQPDGVPSVFFYSPERGVRTGRNAVTSAAKPVQNRIRYLKRSISEPLMIGGKPVVINGKQWLYDDAIREVVQAVLREACLEYARLRAVNEAPYQVSLAYPARFSPSERERLIQIVNSAKLEDGRHFQVIGTIAEPAAAGLDYLSQINCTEKTTVMVFDLGGGTFDLSLVTCYPNGKRKADGSIAYYEMHADGLRSIGGREFDEVIYHLLHDKIDKFLRQNGLSMTANLELRLRENAERIKRELTDSDFAVHEAYIPSLSEDNIPFELTRQEFESDPRVVEMLDRMTAMARRMITDPHLPRPKTIVLTGGSSRMPMIPKALAKMLPEFAGSISSVREYNPAAAISCGAARFGVPEPTTGKPRGITETIRHLEYEIGLYHVRSKHDEKGFIDCIVPRGTVIPFTSNWNAGRKVCASNYVSWSMYEATTVSPDRNEPQRDYHLIKEVCIDYGEVVPEGTESESRLIVDENGLITMEARKDPHSKPVVGTYQLVFNNS